MVTAVLHLNRLWSVPLKRILLTSKQISTATGQVPDPDRLERAREAAAFFCEHT